MLDHCAIQGRAVPNAVKRINVGGKLLTNLLKETVSFTKVLLPSTHFHTSQAPSRLVSEAMQRGSFLVWCLMCCVCCDVGEPDGRVPHGQ